MKMKIWADFQICTSVPLIAFMRNAKRFGIVCVLLLLLLLFLVFLPDVSGTSDRIVRIDVRIDVSISITPLIIKLGKQVYLNNLRQMRLIEQVLVTSSRQDPETN